MEQQSPHHLKSNPNFLTFCRQHSDQSWKTLWSTFQQLRSKLKSPLINIPVAQIKVEKPLGSLLSRLRLKSPLITIAPVSRLKSSLVTFHQDWGWKAPWSPQLNIKVEKLLSRHSSGSRFENSLDYLSSRSRSKSPLVTTALVPRLKSPLVTFLQDQGWKDSW